MAKENKFDEKKKLEEEKEKPKKEKVDEHEVLIRVFSYDLPGSKNIYAALRKIKGVSWAISNALCSSLGIERTKKISELSKEEIAKIEAFLSNLPLPEFLKNRRSDPESGETSHLYSTDLDLKKDFDIKRLRKIRSYKGIRHASGLPVRGQRTRANFRKKGSAAVGVTKKAPSKSGK